MCVTFTLFLPGNGSLFYQLMAKFQIDYCQHLGTLDKTTLYTCIEIFPLALGGLQMGGG